ncbi:unnamed protein product [Cuscuta epithymum]|uniref:Rapid ALkalinization Factor n=1 Tax=Cuscuta epithymum TaxID=186058 RepID=A0AAV0GL76_9ASTE|nr:unnamed protein product [Cuscuta epithymum]
MAKVSGIVVVCLIGLIACTNMFSIGAANEISNGAMRKDLPFCGHGDKNCKPVESNTPYTRGCNAADRCRGGDDNGGSPGA